MNTENLKLKNRIMIVNYKHLRYCNITNYIFQQLLYFYVVKTKKVKHQADHL